MTGFIRKLIYGKCPIHRTNPEPGQSEWYYLDSRNTDTFDDMKEIDVESRDSPNPYANEIQNYLFHNNKYVYKQLYGDTPPFQENQNNIEPKYWECATDGKRVYDNVVKKEGNFVSPNQNTLDYAISTIKGGLNILGNFSNVKKMNVTDKYKHAYINCNAAQYGQGGTDIATLISNLREWNDKRKRSNTLDSSEADQYANRIGRLLGGKYPNGDCDELIQKYIKKNW